MGKSFTGVMRAPGGEAAGYRADATLSTKLSSHWSKPQLSQVGATVAANAAELAVIVAGPRWSPVPARGPKCQVAMTGGGSHR